MDAARFKKMFLPYHRKLYGVALRLLENEEDAEDVVQEAYLKLWDKRSTLSIIQNPEAFCTTLVKNLCFDLLRSGQYTWNRQQVQLADNLPLASSDDIEAYDNAQAVKEIVSHLPQQQQRVILLHDLKGCSYEEVEKITGMNAINLRVTLSRARKKIREEFLKLYKKR